MELKCTIVHILTSLKVIASSNGKTINVKQRFLWKLYTKELEFQIIKYTYMASDCNS